MLSDGDISPVWLSRTPECSYVEREGSTNVPLTLPFRVRVGCYILFLYCLLLLFFLSLPFILIFIIFSFVVIFICVVVLYCFFLFIR